MKRFLILFVVLIAGCMTSHPLPPMVNWDVFKALSVYPDEFDSANEAAIYALQRAYDLHPQYEVGGVIVQLDDKFKVGNPHTDFSAAFVGTDVDHPEHYKGKIIGDYHTHICLTKSFVPGDFSPTDLNDYAEMHVEGFMLDTCTGDVHAFKTGVDVRYPDAADTVGRIVGHVNVTGVDLE